jgi:mono/diheme cytochrome c family protein
MYRTDRFRCILVGSTREECQEEEGMWTKTLIRFFCIALVGIWIAAIASAASAPNARKGKAYFKKNCRVCHDGNTEGIPGLQPSDLIMDQWDKAFEDEEDVAECVPRVKEKTGVELTEQDLLDIQKYLVDGAADGERPMTCG